MTQRTDSVSPLFIGSERGSVRSRSIVSARQREILLFALLIGLLGVWLGRAPIHGEASSSRVQVSRLSEPERAYLEEVNYLLELDRLWREGALAVRPAFHPLRSPRTTASGDALGADPVR